MARTSPEVGQIKIENGRKYRFNENRRWERVYDEAEAAPMPVLSSAPPEASSSRKTRAPKATTSSAPKSRSKRSSSPASTSSRSKRSTTQASASSRSRKKKQEAAAPLPPWTEDPWEMEVPVTYDSSPEPEQSYTSQLFLPRPSSSQLLLPSGQVEGSSARSKRSRSTTRSTRTAQATGDPTPRRSRGRKPKQETPPPSPWEEDPWEMDVPVTYSPSSFPSDSYDSPPLLPNARTPQLLLPSGRAEAEPSASPKAKSKRTRSSTRRSRSQKPQAAPPPPPPQEDPWDANVPVSPAFASRSAWEEESYRPQLLLPGSQTTHPLLPAPRKPPKLPDEGPRPVQPPPQPTAAPTASGKRRPLPPDPNRVVPAPAPKPTVAPPSSGKRRPLPPDPNRVAPAPTPRPTVAPPSPGTPGKRRPLPPDASRSAPEPARAPVRSLEERPQLAARQTHTQEEKAGSATRVAEHLAESAVAWKVGKLLGAPLSAVASHLGYSPEVGQALGESVVQAVTSTAIQFMKQKGMGKVNPMEMATHFLTQGVAAFLGKQSGEDLSEALHFQKLAQDLAPVIAEHLRGVTNLTAAHKQRLYEAVVKKVVERGKHDLRLLAGLTSVFAKSPVPSERLSRLLLDLLVAGLVLRKYGNPVPRRRRTL